MATLPPPAVKEFSGNSIEKKIYSLVDSLEKYIPLMNDRNRLSFALLNYIKGEGDPPLVTVKNNKLKLIDISKEKLAELIDDKLKEIEK